MKRTIKIRAKEVANVNLIISVSNNKQEAIYNLDNVKKLCKLKAKRCIGCGLCSYVCPSKIRLRELVGEAKKKIDSGVK